MKSMNNTLITKVAVACALTVTLNMASAEQKHNQNNSGFSQLGQSYEQTTSNNLFRFAKGRIAQETLSSADMRLMDNDPDMLWADAIDLNLALINEATESMVINIAPGIEFTAIREDSYSLPKQGPGSMVWEGSLSIDAAASIKGATLDEIDTGRVLIAREGDRIIGNVSFNGQLYSITTTENGRGYIMAEYVKPYINYENDVLYPDQTILDMPSRVVNQNIKQPGQNRAQNIVITVLMGATPSVVQGLGGVNKVNDFINLNIAESNMVLKNIGGSFSNTRLEKASNSVSQTAADKANSDLTLAGLANTSDGYLDFFTNTIRDRNNADIVGLVMEFSSGTCGEASQIGSNANNPFFGLSAKNSCKNTFTMIHEIGHLMGGRHENDAGTTPFADAHGYIITNFNGKTIQTVMAGGLESIVPRFSDFNKNVLMSDVAGLGLGTDAVALVGLTLGEQGVSHMAKTVVNRRHAMAAYK